MPTGIYDRTARRIAVPEWQFDLMLQMRKHDLSTFTIGLFFDLNQRTIVRIFRDHGITFMRGKPGNGLGKEWATTLAAKQLPTTADLNWAAGFLEGEASFSKGRIHVSQVNPQPLIKLLRLFGGTRTSPRQRAAGKPIGDWRASGSRARGVMMTLYHLMSAVRQAQIRNALRTGGV